MRKKERHDLRPERQRQRGPAHSQQACCSPAPAPAQIKRHSQLCQYTLYQEDGWQSFDFAAPATTPFPSLLPFPPIKDKDRPCLRPLYQYCRGSVYVCGSVCRVASNLCDPSLSPLSLSLRVGLSLLVCVGLCLRVCVCCVCVSVPLCLPRPPPPAQNKSTTIGGGIGPSRESACAP